MIVLGYAAIFAGALLLIAGVSGSSLASVAQGAPDRVKGGPAPSSSATGSSSSVGSTAANLPPAHEFDGFLAAGERLLKYDRKDQGRDILLAPGAPLLAPGDYEVVRIGVDPRGFGPDYPIIRLLSGRYSGQDIYYGHTDTAVKVGQHGRAGDVVAHTSRTGHNAPAGWAEIGFAPSGTPGPWGQPVPF